MAWTSVKTWAAGEVVTAAMMNTYVSANDEALRAGGLAIASQASGDYIKASSATQLSRIAGSGVFADLSPLTTRGDILYGSSGTVTGTRLAVGGAGTHLGSDGTDVAWEADPTFATLSPLTTRGDLLVGTAGAVTGARLGKGSSSQVLTMADANDIGWAAASSGKIVQVLGTTYATMADRSLSSFAETGLTLNITLADDSNKVIVLCQMGGVQKDASNTKAQFKLLRDIDGGAETQIGYEPNAGYNASTTALSVGMGAGWTILDSPATASEITYHVEFASQSNAAVVYCQVNSATSSLTLIEVDA
jgi:hypothetical protein